MYVAPAVEVIEVMVEAGFQNSVVPNLPNSGLDD